MVEVGIVFGVALLLTLGLSFVVRIPAFGSPRTRLVTIAVVAALLIVGFAAGTFWARGAVDDQVQVRVRDFRRELAAYRKRPLDLLTSAPVAGLPPVTESASVGRGVVLHSEVSELWVFRCVYARVTSARVVVTTRSGKCRW